MSDYPKVCPTPNRLSKIANQLNVLTVACLGSRTPFGVGHIFHHPPKQLFSPCAENFGEVQTMAEKVIPKIATTYPLTKTEQLYHLCEGDERSHYDFDAEGWNYLVNHRQANRQFHTVQFSVSFLDALLEISRASEREVAVSYDTEKKSMIFEWGDAGNVAPQDAARVLTILHTHPRATKNSVPVTTLATHDLYSLIAFSRAQGSAAVSTVIGRVCGGELEVASVAMQGASLYVANAHEKLWIENMLALPMPEPLRKILTATKTAPLTVEVNPKKISEIVARQKFLKKLEKSALEFFGKAKR